MEKVGRGFRNAPLQALCRSVDFAKRGVVVKVKCRLTSERKLRPVCSSGVHTASLEPRFNQAGPRYIVLYRRSNQNQGDTSGGEVCGAQSRTPDNRKRSYFLGLVSTF